MDKKIEVSVFHFDTEKYSHVKWFTLSDAEKAKRYYKELNDEIKDDELSIATISVIDM